MYTEGVENANGLSSSGLGTGVKRGMIFFSDKFRFAADKNLGVTTSKYVIQTQ